MILSKSVGGKVEQKWWNSVGRRLWWNSEVEQCWWNSDSETVMVE